MTGDASQIGMPFTYSSLIPAWSARCSIESVIIARSLPSASVTIDRDRGAVDDGGILAAEEQDDARDLLRLRPGVEVGAGHRLAIGRGVDDAGKNGVGPH